MGHILAHNNNAMMAIGKMGMDAPRNARCNHSTGHVIRPRGMLPNVS